MAEEKHRKYLELKAPKCFSHIHPPVVYYHDKNKNEEYVIFAPNYASFDTCYKYNITRNEYTDFAPYPNNFSPSRHGHAVDSKNGKYYIFGGSKAILGEFDLNSEDAEPKWKIHHDDTNDIHLNLENSQGIIIPDLNKLIIIETDHTCSVNLEAENKKYINIDEYGEELTDNLSANYFRVLFSMKTIKLYIISSNKDAMFSLDCSKPFDKDSNNFRDIPLPSGLKIKSGVDFRLYLGAISYDGNIMVIFDIKRNEAWSLDIGHDSSEWMKSKFEFRELNKRYTYSIKVVVGKENDAYFFNTYPRKDLFCIRLSLNDIIPREMLNGYSKPLVYGFVRESSVGLSIPHEIVQLLVTFYM